MKARRWLMAWGIGGALATASMGQGTVIESFQDNGLLSWTNAINSNAIYRVEWAARVEGPWYRTFDNIGSLDGQSLTGFTVEAPMFYRVVMATNPPPWGMVWIDGGDVELGQTDIATPVHTNFIGGFWMDEMEVTKAQWDEVYVWATNHGYSFDNAGSGKTNNHPIHTVNWYDSVKWCNARSEKEGLKTVYSERVLVGGHPVFRIYRYGNADISNSWVNWSYNGYRLPTEAEWEKAARGGRQRRLFPWGGDTIQHAQANYYAETNTYAYDTSPTPGYHPSYNFGEHPFTSPAGSFPGNGYGLHDMAGNVWEWCWDWNGAYSAGYATDPRGANTGTTRIMRGGSWTQRANSTRAAFRGANVPELQNNYWGFRCVRGP